MAALEGARAKLRRLRASVLKSAVEGRLTADWRAEHKDIEPASELLERILVERRERQLAAQLDKWRARKAKAGWTAERIAAAEPAERTKLAAKYQEPKGPATDDLPELPATWCWATVEAICDVFTGTTPNRGTARFYENGSIPWITSTAVNHDFVDKETEFVTEAATLETRLALYPAGTLLIALYGEGKTRGMVTELRIDATINQALAALCFPRNQTGLRDYSKVFLKANYASLRRKAAGGMQPNLNLSLVNAIAVAVPPLAEQAEIVRRVDEQLSRIDAAEKVIDTGLARAKRLRQAILKRAFAGRLVPQDPRDEPASMLLERIRAERAAAAASNGKTTRASIKNGTGGGDAPARKGTKKEATRVAAVAKSTPPTESAIRNPQSAIAPKQLSLLGDEPEAAHAIDAEQIAAAFQRSHDGYSTDYVLASPEANARFLDAAASLGVDAPAVAINKHLLIVRKTQKGLLPKTSRRYRNPADLDPFEFVAEWAVRIVQRKVKKELGREPSLDTLLCDPELAKRFDEIAAKLKALDGKRLPYRWFALALRKRKHSDAGGLVAEFAEPLPLEEAVAKAPKGPGVYQVLAGDRPLYVAAADDVRKQLLVHGLTTGDAQRVVPAWEARKPQTVALLASRQRADELASAARSTLRPQLNLVL
ncbi:restriction endonuclease subunit S [Botrimarina mediterranea]|uniref:restriction endonuclease subunit S n=1 Tax=Botrimarina mediterranea TaxID=2528022 RepID=UPI001E40F876|nr:restriction endonuclease subunit S [Botrimarina mediterranea]